MKILNEVTFVFLVLFFAITIPNAGFASSLSVSVGCFDNQTGGGSTPGAGPREYTCAAFVSGGTAPYTFSWQDFDIPHQVVVRSFGNAASYEADPCIGETDAGGIVAVEDSSGNLVIASGTLQLDCPN